MKFNLKDFIRPNILDLKPYTSLRDQIGGNDLIYLEANENPFGKYNRYPDSGCLKLRSRLAELNDVEVSQTFIGNGSDELIDLIMRTFCVPGKDTVLTIDPSFVMYEFYAKINDIKIEKLKLNKNFQIQKSAFETLINSSKFQILFICSPNNPTGNSIDDLEYFIAKFNGLVVIDEAYIEFAQQRSAVELLNKYPNLIILKTLSKAYGMAGLRIGIGYSSEEIAEIMMTVKPPYNMSSENQKLALQNLQNVDVFESNKTTILAERQRLNLELNSCDTVVKIFPSDANFLLVEFKNAETVFQSFINNNILTSLRHPALKNCLRISIGTPKENDLLISALKNLN